MVDNNLRERSASATMSVLMIDSARVARGSVCPAHDKAAKCFWPP